MTTKESSEKNVSEVEPRTRRVRQSEIDEQTDLRSVYALEEYMTVVPDDDGGLCEVYTESGERYVMDVRESVDSRANENAPCSRDAVDGACTCPDVRHNLDHDEDCKHVRRARFALGIDAVPTNAVEGVEVDESLGRHTNASLRFVSSDGGVIEAEEDAELLTDDEEDNCEECAELSGLPCFECYMDEHGF